MSKLVNIHDELNKLDTFHRAKRAELESKLAIEEEKARAASEKEASEAKAARRKEAARHAVHLLKVSTDADKLMARLAELLRDRRDAARAIRAVDPEAGRIFGHHAERAQSINGAMNHHGLGLLADVKRERGGETLAEQDARYFKTLADQA